MSALACDPARRRTGFVQVREVRLAQGVGGHAVLDRGLITIGEHRALVWATSGMMMLDPALVRLYRCACYARPDCEYRVTGLLVA